MNGDLYWPGSAGGTVSYNVSIMLGIIFFIDLELTLLIPMGLHVPMGISVTGVIVLGASNLNLSETPLWKVDITSTQITAKGLVLETESSGQSANLALVPGRNVADNLNLPVILVVTDSQVAIAGYLLVGLGDGGGNIVRV